MPSIKIIRGQYGEFTKGCIAEVNAKTAERLIAKGIAVKIKDAAETSNMDLEDKQLQYEKLKSELKNIKKNTALAEFAEANHLIFEEDDSTIAEKAEKLLVQLEASFFDGGK